MFVLHKETIWLATPSHYAIKGYIYTELWMNMQQGLFAHQVTGQTVCTEQVIRRYNNLQELRMSLQDYLYAIYMYARGKEVKEGKGRKEGRREGKKAREEGGGRGNQRGRR